MKAHDNGCFYSVTISRREVADFRSQWPCSGLPDKAIWAQFDKRNGDLVDMEPDLSSADGGALLAIIADGQRYAANRLGLEFNG
jgi:hypothetical protein